MREFQMAIQQKVSGNHLLKSWFEKESQGRKAASGRESHIAII